MSRDTFTPRLGRIGDVGRQKSIRTATRIATEAARNTLRRKSHIDPNAHRRGLASGVMAASTFRAPGTRRAVVRARYVRQTAGDLGAARAHVRYILRDGTTREGQAGHLYDAGRDGVDADAFLDRSKSDPHQFRFIVSMEDGAQLPDLKPVIRDLMGQMERDLGTRLDWVAVDHFNTSLPHTHVVVRGRDDRGKDLVIARDYIAQGMRARAEALVTLELGPEAELERLAKRTNEIAQERLTSLDRTLMKRAVENVIVTTAARHDDSVRHAQLVGRLRTLERLGLAEEKRAGVWALDPDLEPKLRRLGERADKIKMMQRALADVGIVRAPGLLAVFDRGTRTEPLVGRAVGSGLVDELSDRSWIVVDGADGRVHYVELGRIRREAVPSRGAIVRIGPDRSEVPDRVAKATPQIDVLSHSMSRDAARYDGPSWLDTFVVDGVRRLQATSGFGRELGDAITARRDWLLSQRLARISRDGRFELSPHAVDQLRNRELTRLADTLTRETGRPHIAARPGAEISGTVGRTIDTPSGRHIVVSNGRTAQIVPWSKTIEGWRGQDIAGSLRGNVIVPTRTLGRERT